MTKAMIKLYRYKWDNVQDEEELLQLRYNDRREFLALKERAGDNRTGGLGGFSVALAQAGRFIHHRKISFNEYTKIYMEMRKSENLSHVLHSG